jgi:hypothetical protein
VPGYEGLHRDVPWYERVGPEWEKSPPDEPPSPEVQALENLEPIPL